MALFFWDEPSVRPRLRSALRWRLACALLFWTFVLGCGSLRAASAQLNRFEFSQLHMGTLFRLTLFASTPEKANHAASLAYDRIEALEQILSDYRDQSELRRAVSTASSEPVVVSEDLFRVLWQSRHIASLSSGAFDPTVGPLVKLWRRARETKKMPAEAELRAALRQVGYQSILLNRRMRSFRLAHPGVEIDLGGIGKGYAADAVLEILAQQGITRALIDAGGDLRIGLPPPGRSGWTVRLDPEVGQDLRLELSQCAVATSGDEYQWAEIGNHRYSHIVDPRTGLGVERRQAALVVAGSAAKADAWATALCVLSADVGIDLINRLDGLSAQVVVSSEGGIEVLRSADFPP